MVEFLITCLGPCGPVPVISLTQVLDFSALKTFTPGKRINVTPGNGMNVSLTREDCMDGLSYRLQCEPFWYTFICEGRWGWGTLD